MTKAEMINRLAADSVNTVLDPESESTGHLKDIFTHGFKGYERYSIRELEQEIHNRGLDNNG